jgi:hypothetical protein
MTFAIEDKNVVADAEPQNIMGVTRSSAPKMTVSLSSRECDSRA